MKLTRAAAAELKGENAEVVGYAEKAVDASAGLPAGWAAAVDGDGDTYYVRSQPRHLPHCCHALPELDPASSRCAVEQGDGRDAVGGPSVRSFSRRAFLAFSPGPSLPAVESVRARQSLLARSLPCGVCEFCMLSNMLVCVNSTRPRTLSPPLSPRDARVALRTPARLVPSRYAPLRSPI